MARKKVLIVGGGISGLTVAHECIQQGFEVHVYERKSHCGGKAFGLKNEDGLHIEHSIRTYGAGYHHLFHTLKAIPAGDGKTVFDNLTALPGVLMTSRQDPSRNRLLPTTYATPKFRKLLVLLRILRSWQLNANEAIQFIRLSMDYALKSEERRATVYAGKSFADYVGLSTYSQPFQQFLTAFLDIIVAAKPYAAAEVILSLMNKIMFPNKVAGLLSTMNVMNGPTNDRFIDPWVTHLTMLGVQFHLNSSLDDVVVEAGQVSQVMINKTEVNKADAFVLAIPYQHLRRLVPDLQLSQKRHREWSFSYQFYLRAIPTDLRINQTFTLVLDSPWKLVYLIEAEPLWTNVDFRPDVRAILSVTLSNVNTPGLLTPKPLHQCTDEEVQAELLHQIGFAYPDLIVEARLDKTVAYIPETDYQQRKAEFMGWDSFPPNALGYRWLTESTLFIPEATNESPISVETHLPNLFLAGEFIYTSYRTPTMEQANESGKMCAASLCQYFGLIYAKADQKRPEPPFKRIRQIDRWLHRQ
ncbi:FAD-dependent oxidoreductase [Spirosoma sp. KCTC 42546]|uniref:oleate hydratase n=1 Tax=Spirosoma sp. KCTC 42546 TaxID=2520506 RepID=UPI0011578390|nr:oleate hydratase [Spirosoma sp. KCTC 42546]QDK77934.1 FAD-dependent oxidoreductase [Spirosoma sp. KCTC 42546]